MPSQPLTDQDLRILEFESRQWKLRGSKENAIRDEFNMKSTSYYLYLARLIDKPAAEQHSPLLVRRLRRMRDDMITKKYVRGSTPERGAHHGSVEAQDLPE